MNLAASDIEVESSLLRRWARLGRLQDLGYGQRLCPRPTSPDSDKVVDRARPGRHAKSLSEGCGDPSVRPTSLAKPADQVRVGLKLALGRPVIGLGEEVGNLIIEVHARVAASTVRHCPGLSGKYLGIFGLNRRAACPWAGWTRICPDTVRVCPGLSGGGQSTQDILRRQNKDKRWPVLAM